MLSGYYWGVYITRSPGLRERTEWRKRSLVAHASRMEALHSLLSNTRCSRRQAEHIALQDGSQTKEAGKSSSVETSCRGIFEISYTGQESGSSRKHVIFWENQMSFKRAKHQLAPFESYCLSNLFGKLSSSLNAYLGILHVVRITHISH